MVVITGGGRGLIEAYTVAYAQAGASGIVLAARSQDEPDGVTRRVPGISPKTKV